jgi:hypothetical protein
VDSLPGVGFSSLVTRRFSVTKQQSVYRDACFVHDEIATPVAGRVASTFSGKNPEISELSVGLVRSEGDANNLNSLR